MNAASQRRLTPVLVVLCACLALVLVAFLAGIGRRVHWRKAEASQISSSPVKAIPTPVPTALAAYTDVWQRPLFNPDRRPAADVAGDDSVSLGDLELTGIIITPGLRMALLHASSSGQEVRVREGSALPDGRWTLATLTPRSAVFDSGGERKELVLKVAAPAVAKADAQQPAAFGPPRAGAPVTSQVVPQPPPPSMMAGPVITPQTGSNQADVAAQRARIEALKAAVLQRRAEQAAHPANEGVR